MRLLGEFESQRQVVMQVLKVAMNDNKHTNDYPESIFYALNKPMGKTHTSSIVLRD